VVYECSTNYKLPVNGAYGIDPTAYIQINIGSN